MSTEPLSPVGRVPGIAMSGSRLTGLKIFHVISFTGPTRLNGQALNFSFEDDIRPKKAMVLLLNRM